MNIYIFGFSFPDLSRSRSYSTKQDKRKAVRLQQVLMLVVDLFEKEENHVQAINFT